MNKNPLQNNLIEGFSVPKNVWSAIQKASARTGVNFSYMVEKAAAESSFNPQARASKSTATGLYQFIEGTWLQMVRTHGEKYGLSEYATKIDENGRVSDSQTRREILNLRNDPEISSYMAAEYTNENYTYMKEALGEDVGTTELYLAHFLGAGGACGFMKAMQKNPNMIAADIFPKESRANRSVFYDSQTGAPRSLREVYASFDKRFNMDQGSADAVVAERINDTSLGPDQPILRRKSFASQESQGIRMKPYLNEGNDDSFSQLAALVSFSSSGTGQTPSKKTSGVFDLLGNRTEKFSLSSSENKGRWQIFPPSMYNRLALSPAQMMMLSDFNA